jgi:hypothetical protein
MTSKYLIRSVGMLSCMALVATGWDAEAGWRRHHHRKAACCEPVCCEPVYEAVREPVCCEPAPAPVCCEPVREPVCCETVIVAPARPCCSSSIVVAETVAPNRQVSVMKTESSHQADVARVTTATAASLKR